MNAKGRKYQEWNKSEGAMGRQYVLVKVADPKGAYSNADHSRYSIVKRYI